MASSNSELSSTSLETVTEASAENVVGNPLSEKPETLVEPVPEGTAIEDDLAPKSIMKSDLIDKSGPANKSVSEKSATALIGSEAPESPVGEILKVVSTESDLLEKQEPLIESISKVVEGSLSEISDVIPEKVVSTENTSIEKSQETTTDNDKFQEIEEIVEPTDAIKKSILDSPVSLVEPSTSQEENKLDMASGVESASSVDETTTIKLVIKNVEVPEKSPAEIVDDVSLSGLEEAVQNLEAIIQHTESETQDKMETEPGPTDAEEPEKSAKILTSFEKDVNTVPELQREDEPMIVTKSSEKESSKDSTVDNNVTEAKITTTVDAKSDEKMDFEEETNEMDVNEKIDNAECVDNKVAADQIPKSLEKMETSETVDGIVEDALSVVAIVCEAIQQDTVKLKKGSEEEISKPVKISKDEKVKDSVEPQQTDKESQAGKENTAVNDDVTMIVLDSDEENDTIIPTSKPTVTPVKQPSVLIQISPKVVASRQKTPSPAKPMATPSNTITPPKAKTPLKPITTPTGNILKRKLENEVSAQTSPPKSHEVKECVNFECKKQIKEYLKAPAFILSFYRISRKLNKIQYICLNCFDDAVLQYEELCGALEDWQPLLIQNIPCRDDLVEISDSSDDEDGDNKPIPDDESPLSKEAIKLVETDLEDILADTLKRVRISNQISWAKSMLETKAKINEEISNDILDDLRTLQRKADKMYKKLYSTSEPIYEELPPLDIHHTVEISTISIPPLGDLTFPSISKGASYFGVRHRLLAAWSPCTAIDVIPLYDSPDKICKVLFKGSNSKTHVTKNLPLKHISYFDAARVRLTIGTRVIALFNLQKANNLKQPTKNSYFPGIIAEPIQMTNAYRYLVFFDDGYAQYVRHEDVRVVCETSANVWEDVHIHSRDFMANYLKNYRNERPMVQVKRGQKMITEYKGKWTFAKVTEIDASLIQVHFEQDNRYEWIYRGSARLGPLYRENRNRHASASVTQLQKRNEPSVEYITIVDDDDKPGEHTSKTVDKIGGESVPVANEVQSDQSSTSQAIANRAVAKKSTSLRPLQASQPASQPTQPAVKLMNTNTIIIGEDEKLIGKVVYYRARKNLPPNKFKNHSCSPACLFNIQHKLNAYSPLAKPLLSGFERQLSKNKTKKTVNYRAPCGRRLRNMSELHRFLRLTNCSLNVDNFDFDILIHCLAEYVIESAYVNIRDISDGKEVMPIPCVNYFDDTQPPPCIYSTKRIPTENVSLNLDTDFLEGCNCTDDCSDKTKCRCWQLTVAGATFGNPNIDKDLIGYTNKRLLDPVITGIYECNPSCKCKANCLNKVVQQSIQVKLQVFKTTNRGWGLRCLNDIPKGSYICCYAGHLLTEEAANKICQEGGDHGDEYFAELDYIEVVEKFKEGYESDAYESSENESEDYEPEVGKNEDSDDDFRTPVLKNSDSMAVRTRSQMRSDANNEKAKQKTLSSKSRAKTPLTGATAAAVALTASEVKSEKNGDEPVISISDDEEMREPVNLMPNPDMLLEKDEVPTKHRSVRRMFGKGEHVYIMDAKKSGNIGRYFNHSCNPNLFVQNVFVDTHDLRFPWVAFFASSHIRSGTELTWNYNYDVGSVPGKVLYCQCGAPNCRQRLL